MFQEQWVAFIIDLINDNGWAKDKWKKKHYNSEKMEINKMAFIELNSLEYFVIHRLKGMPAYYMFD